MILHDYDIYSKIPLCEDWIDWENPRLFHKEMDIEAFLKNQYASNPNLDHDVKHYISQIDQVWFYGTCNGFMLKRWHIVEVRRQ